MSGAPGGSGAATRIAPSRRHVRLPSERLLRGEGTLTLEEHRRRAEEEDAR